MLVDLNTIMFSLLISLLSPSTVMQSSVYEADEQFRSQSFRLIALMAACGICSRLRGVPNSTGPWYKEASAADGSISGPTGKQIQH